MEVTTPFRDGMAALLAVMSDAAPQSQVEATKAFWEIRKFALPDAREAYDALLTENEALRAELAEARALNAKITCAYCGEETDRNAPDFMERVVNHSATCEKRPEPQLLKIIEGLRSDLINAAKNTLAAAHDLCSDNATLCADSSHCGCRDLVAAALSEGLGHLGELDPTLGFSAEPGKS